MNVCRFERTATLTLCAHVAGTVTCHSSRKAYVKCPKCKDKCKCGEEEDCDQLPFSRFQNHALKRRESFTELHTQSQRALRPIATQ